MEKIREALRAYEIVIDWLVSDHLMDKDAIARQRAVLREAKEELTKLFELRDALRRLELE
jgi:hypothetical protein